MDSKLKKLFMGFRQITLMLLGLLEDYMELERSVPPKRKYKQDRTGDSVV
jgi:hypothetical protein